MPTAAPSRPIATHVLVGKNLVAGAPTDAALRQVREALLPVLEQIEDESAPFILETPGSRSADDPGISLLKELRT